MEANKLSKPSKFSQHRTKQWTDHPRVLHRLLITGGLQSLWTHHPDKSFMELLHMVIYPDNEYAVSLAITEDQFRNNLYQLLKKANIDYPGKE